MRGRDACFPALDAQQEVEPLKDPLQRVFELDNDTEIGENSPQFKALAWD
jgi:hypothetical protein